MICTTDLRSSLQELAASSQVRPSLIVVVEGAHDLEFLLHISRDLHAADASVPDLGHLADRGELLLLPVGGSPLALWSSRLAPLGLPEIHIYDREAEPEAQLRRRLARQINARPGCFATLATKRALENYLHPRAIADAGGPEISVTDDDCVSEVIAKRQFETRVGCARWAGLSR
ncbi:MAG: hypothetical protein WD851_20810 [Pirellulales bacterium]